MTHKVNSIKVMLELPMPSPAPQAAPAQKSAIQKVPVEDKVREALECIDSGHESGVEWAMINRLYADLCKLKKPTERAENLKKMIEPVLSKYGYHKVPATK
jgi:hypothetical protein